MGYTVVSFPMAPLTSPQLLQVQFRTWDILENILLQTISASRAGRQRREERKRLKLENWNKPLISKRGKKKQQILQRTALRGKWRERELKFKGCFTLWELAGQLHQFVCQKQLPTDVILIFAKSAFIHKSVSIPSNMHNILETGK